MNQEQKHRNDWVEEEVKAAKRIGVMAGWYAAGFITGPLLMFGFACWAILCLTFFERLRINSLPAQVFLSVGVPGIIAVALLIRKRQFKTGSSEENTPNDPEPDA